MADNLQLNAEVALVALLLNHPELHTELEHIKPTDLTQGQNSQRIYEVGLELAKAGELTKPAVMELVGSEKLVEKYWGFDHDISRLENYISIVLAGEDLARYNLRHQLADYQREIEKNKLIPIEQRVFRPSLIDLTRKIGGLYRGEMSVNGGRPGMGKCLGKGTPILMFDGTVKPVELIKTGDLLMGPDSKPRQVLSTTEGYGKLYEVKQNKGLTYIVNENHILSLKRSKNEGSHKHGDILNISVKDYLDRWPAGNESRYKGYKVSVEFAERPLELDPYFVGLWLGDGSKANSTITSEDKEVIDYIYKFAKKIGLQVTHCDGNMYSITKGYHGKPSEYNLKNHLHELNLLNNKHIPQDYLINSKKNRLKLLAGLLDSDGHYSYDGGIYEITQKDENLIKQIKFLADSLGFKTNVSDKIARIKSINYECKVFRLRISGYLDQIPCKIARKKARLKKGNIDPTHCGIFISSAGEGNYYGFELDGDHLFLLEDMTVTHNSSLGLQHVREFGQPKQRSVYFAFEMSGFRFIDRMIASESDSLLFEEIIELSYVNNQMKERDFLRTFANLHKEEMYLVTGDKTNNIADYKVLRRMILSYIKLGVRYFCLDSINLMHWSEFNGNRNYEMEAILGDMIGICTSKDYGYPHITVVAHLNRACESRADKRPIMSDLKDTGGLEQWADLVMFLYRDGYYNPDTEHPNVAEILIEKNRNRLAPQVARVFWQADKFTFKNLQHENFGE